MLLRKDTPNDISKNSGGFGRFWVLNPIDKQLVVKLSQVLFPESLSALIGGINVVIFTSFISGRFWVLDPIDKQLVVKLSQVLSSGSLSALIGLTCLLL